MEKIKKLEIEKNSEKNFETLVIEKIQRKISNKNSKN